MRREGPSIALGLKMALAAVLTPLLVLAAITAVVVEVPSWRIWAGLAIAVVIGMVVASEERKRTTRTHELSVGEAPALHGMVERLCVLADLPKPVLVASDVDQPNSWVTDLPGRRARLHVTRGLLELLTPAELEAVLAHELAHVAHRDATVMTVVGLPGSLLLQGGRHLGRHYSPVMVGGWIAWVVGALASVGTTSLARGRELSADATAARLTGHPAALASALLKASGEIARLPARDLRGAAALDAFNLLPARRPEVKGWRGSVARSRPARALVATHPTLATRLAALERLEGRTRRLSLDH